MPLLQSFIDAPPTAELEPITDDYTQSDEVVCPTALTSVPRPTLSITVISMSDNIQGHGHEL